MKLSIPRTQNDNLPVFWEGKHCTFWVILLSTAQDPHRVFLHMNRPFAVVLIGHAGIVVIKAPAGSDHLIGRNPGLDDYIKLDAGD